MGAGEEGVGELEITNKTLDKKVTKILVHETDCQNSCTTWPWKKILLRKFAHTHPPTPSLQKYNAPSLTMSIFQFIIYEKQISILTSSPLVRLLRNRRVITWVLDR